MKTQYLCFSIIVLGLMSCNKSGTYDRPDTDPAVSESEEIKLEDVDDLLIADKAKEDSMKKVLGIE